MTDLYERLAQFVDNLPAGFPRTESGVELRILRKLFTPEEAKLFMHLTLIGEEPRVIAHRAKQPLEGVSQLLEGMEEKGLVFAVRRADKAPEYSAQQFAVGFWEGQVNRLDRELVEAVGEYLPIAFDLDLWRKAPQMRTIPVGESIPIQTEGAGNRARANYHRNRQLHLPPGNASHRAWLRKADGNLHELRRSC